jgi:ATP-dependent helicase IRC3
MLSLRDYQRAGLDAVHAAEARGVQRMIVMSPTGAGKTVMGSHLLHERGGRTVWMAHRDELVRQAADKIRMVTGAVPGIVKAEEDDCHAQVVVASVQTLVNPRRLARLIAGGEPGQGALFGQTFAPFRTVVVDECHHASADSYVQVLRGLGCFNHDGPLTVGFTATPERTDDKQLGDVFEEIVYQLTILDGIRGGWLCDIRAKQVQLEADFSKLHVRAGEFRDEETAEMLLAADAPRHAAEAYGQHARDRKGVVFTPTVAVARAMAAAFTGAGIRAEAIDGEMPLEERRAILRRLETGETRVVPNAQVLTEGWDSPSVSCCVMARPTRSRPFAIQCIGRVLRPYPGKADALVLDLVGSAVRMDLVTVADLFEIEASAAEGSVLAAVAAKQRAEKEGRGIAQAEDESAEGRVVAFDVELFKGRAFEWVQAAGRFLLDLGNKARVVVEPSQAEPGTYDVARVWKEQDGARWIRGKQIANWVERREPLYAAMDLGYATGAAEDYMRRAGATGLNAKDARWRSEAPTDKQVALLKRRGRWRDGMTKGQASEALSALFAR